MMRWGAMLLILCATAVAQDDGPGKTETEKGSLDDAVKIITPEGLEKHLKEIASDKYEGRNAGYPGNDKVTEYIAKHFKKIGLEPVGDKNDDGEKTYWQHFTFRPRGGARGKKKTRNCVGFFEGSDEKLKEEIVVIGAHHDHAGIPGQDNPGRMGRGTEEDKIWNGADDNGSGTVTVLEIARAFMEGKIKTKRSILFMTFSAEEHGLLGSAHYCNEPIFKLKRHVAMINLDMVGRNPEKSMSVSGTGTSPVWEEVLDDLAKKEELDIKTSAAVSGGSDHASFAAKRIPAVHFFTGFHADYHKPKDHPDKIAYKRMSKVGRFGLRLLVEIANLKKKPRFAGPRRLGVNGQGDSDAGGFEVTRVSADSVAEAAGLEAGDIILSLGGKKLDGDDILANLRKAIRSAPAGEEVKMVILRDGEKKTLKIFWED